MKYATTTKDWKTVDRDVRKALNDKWRPKVYVCRDGFICEISFIKKCDGGIGGFTYGGWCSQPLLKRIAKLIPKKCVIKI